MAKHLTLIWIGLVGLCLVKGDQARITADSPFGYDRIKEIYSEIQAHEPDSGAAKCVRVLLENFEENKVQYDKVLEVHAKECSYEFDKLYDGYERCRRELDGSDAYIKQIDEAITYHGQTCFKNLFSSISINQEKWFEMDSKLAAIGKAFPQVLKPSKSKLQRKSMHWPRALVKVLQMVEGISKKDEVNLMKVQQIALGLKKQDRDASEIFIDNLQKYIKKRSPSKMPRDEDSWDLLKRACEVLSDNTQSNKIYRFNQAFLLLIGIDKHNELFRLGENSFLRSLREQHSNLIPLYMATFACGYAKNADLDVRSDKRPIEGRGNLNYYVTISEESKRDMAGWPFEALY